MSDAQSQRRRPLSRLTLNQLFFRIVLIGIGTLIVVSIILMQQERRQTLQRWQLDTISHSAAVMSSYYSILVTKLILGQTADVESVLEQTQKSEGLRSVRIVPQTEVATTILETCNIDYSKAFFYQAPTCLETTADTIRVYHELRSAGHNLGYLVKEIPLPQLPLFQSTAVGPYMFIVVLCFLGVNMIVLLYFRHYVMRPTKQMIEALNRNQSLGSTPPNYRCQELHTLASSLGTALHKIEEYQETTKRLEYDAKIGQLTSQVAHDIRSPLAALDVVTTFLAELPEEKRVLVRRATTRIKDIANSLIEQSRAIHQKRAPVVATEETTSVELLSSLIDPLMTEKRLQFRARQEVEIQAELSEAAYGLFTCVQPREFKRVLSNLVNNAVEVIEHRGTVWVRLRLCEEMVCVEIHDTGKGIPPEVLSQLTQRGATFGKTGGSGLGLHHARERVEAWGGTLSIASEVGKGTTVTLRLPPAEPPSWFVPSLTLRDGTTLVVLDDDQSIHDIWDGRFAPLRHRLPLLTALHFTTADETRAWHNQCGATTQDVLYLFDYELIGQPANGLALIELLQIQRHALLVTSRYEDAPIRQQCAELGVRLIPKGLAGFVPLIVELPQQPATLTGGTLTIPRGGATAPQASPAPVSGIPCDCVLIDDDTMIHMTWEMVAKNAGKTMQAFAKAEAFFAVAQQIHKHTPIYVDSHLSDGVRGDEVAKTIHDLGFENIYLATGYQAEQFGQLPWIKGIIGKDPPWKPS